MKYFFVTTPIHLSCLTTLYLEPTVSLSFISSLSCPSLSICAGDLYSLMSKLLGQSKDVVHSHKFNPSEMQRTQAELMAQIDSLMQKKDLGSPSARLAFQAREDPVLVRDRVHKFHQLEATAKSPRSKLLAEVQGGSWILFYRCHRCLKHTFVLCVVQYC